LLNQSFVFLKSFKWIGWLVNLLFS
jgi:hypothetical protein